MSCREAALSDVKKKLKTEKETRKRKHAEVEEGPSNSNSKRTSPKVGKATTRHSSGKEKNGMTFACEALKPMPTKGKNAKKVKAVNPEKWVVTPLK